MFDRRIRSRLTLASVLVLVSACAPATGGGSPSVAVAPTVATETQTASAPDATSGASSPDSSAPPVAARPYNIAVITGQYSDPVYITIAKGAASEGLKVGAKVNWQGPAKFDVSQQVPLLDAVLASKPDILLVAPVSDTALIGPLKEFQAAGIPVITFDEDVKDPSVRIAWFTSDAVASGQLAAQFLATSVGTGKVAVMTDQPGDLTLDLRLQGFEAAIAKSPTINYVGPERDNEDPTQVASVAEALLQRVPDLGGILAMDGAQGTGTTTALSEANKLQSVKLVSFGCSPTLVDNLKGGGIYALIMQKGFLMGQLMVDAAVQYLNGDHNIAPKVVIPAIVGTKATIDTPAIQQYECGVQ